MSERNKETIITKDGSTGGYSFCQIYRFKGDKIAEIGSFLVGAA